MPHLTRTFTVNDAAACPVAIKIHEPTLTADKLGLKTWAASFLLAQRLHSLPQALPTPSLPRLRVLELGAGTGLVGIAAGIAWGAEVHLTDLPEIVENLSANISANEALITTHGGLAYASVLNWADGSGAESDADRYDVILAADTFYAAEHPRLLVQTMRKWLRGNRNARIIVEAPLRDAYLPEIARFRDLMAQAGLELLEEGHEFGCDDWGGDRVGDDDSTLVKCWWGVWQWTDMKAETNVDGSRNS